MYAVGDKRKRSVVTLQQPDSAMHHSLASEIEAVRCTDIGSTASTAAHISAVLTI